MNMAGIGLELTIGGLHERYASGELTPEQVIGGIIRRAEADSAMNIWITPPSQERIQPYLDRLASLDPAHAPLWGIPFAVKDNIDVAGWPTTAACPQYAYVPDAHSSVVERLVAAGAIPVGKANLDQFATGLVGTRSPYGETHNALKPELISGGSSSGSAVAVARGHAAFALGTDTAGSGRVPAALHGLVGYKPSLGAWPTRGVVPACASLDCVTVFAHRLEDALTVDRVVRGMEEADPWSRAVPSVSEWKLPARMLLPKDPPGFYGPYGEAYRLAWEKAVERWEQLGGSVEYVDTGLFAEAASILYEGPWVAERWASLGEFIDSHPGAALPVTELILRSGSAAANYDAAAVFRAMHRLQVLRHEARKLLKDAVLVMPTCGGTWTREQVRADPVAANREMGRYTNHCNLLDLSAVAVPAGYAEEAVPFGITLFTLADSESLLVGAAGRWLDADESAWLNGRRQTGTVEAARSSLAAAAAALSLIDNVSAASRAGTTLLAVCGLHMRGYPLEKQLLECGAQFRLVSKTAPVYRFVKLPTVPAKPGLIRCASGGDSIELELWEIPLETFGGFAASIPAPLGIGTVELEDGASVPGFLCEAYAEAEAEDISSCGGWRYVSH